MMIRVKYVGSTYIDYRKIESFELDCEGFLWLISEDGTNIFIKHGSFEWFSTFSEQDESEMITTDE